jgi:hypothetical protein
MAQVLILTSDDSFIGLQRSVFPRLCSRKKATISRESSSNETKPMLYTKHGIAIYMLKILIFYQGITTKSGNETWVDSQPFVPLNLGSKNLLDIVN